MPCAVKIQLVGHVVVGHVPQSEASSIGVVKFEQQHFLVEPRQCLAVFADQRRQLVRDSEAL